MENPQDFIAQWETAAKNAKEAGFDGVESECSHIAVIRS